MDFSWSEDQIMLRDTVRAFSEQELLPKYQHWDRTGEWLTDEYIKKIVDMGLLRPIMQAATRTPLVNTPAEGARLVVRLATDPDLEDVTGRFYTTTPGMRLLPPVPAMLDTRLQRRIWERTEALVGLTPEP